MRPRARGGHARRFRARFIFYAPPQTRRRARGRVRGVLRERPRAFVGRARRAPRRRRRRFDPSQRGVRLRGVLGVHSRAGRARRARPVIRRGGVRRELRGRGFPPRLCPRGRAVRAVATTKGRAQGGSRAGRPSAAGRATRESSLDRSAAAFGDDRAERTAVAVDPKRAYRSVDDAIDRLLLSTGAEWIDVLHVPWLDGVAPDALRGRRSHERITFNGIRGEIDDGSSDDHAYNNKRVVNVFEEPFTTAMDALRWVPLDSYSSLEDSSKRRANVCDENDAFVPERLATSSTLSRSDARHSAVREAHRRALSDAVRSGKVRKLCVSFETPWDACGLELGAAAFFEARELADGFAPPGGYSVARRNENGFLGDAVTGVSLSLSALRDPRLFRRRDDYEATLARWCAPPGVQDDVFFSAAEASGSREKHSKRSPSSPRAACFSPPQLTVQTTVQTTKRRASFAYSPRIWSARPPRSARSRARTSRWASRAPGGMPRPSRWAPSPPARRTPRWTTRRSRDGWRRKKPVGAAGATAGTCTSTPRAWRRWTRRG